jgi:hypothetical protein
MPSPFELRAAAPRTHHMDAIVRPSTGDDESSLLGFTKVRRGSQGGAMTGMARVFGG